LDVNTWRKAVMKDRRGPNRRRQVLIVGRESEPAAAAVQLTGGGTNIATKVVDTISEAIRELNKAGYDAVVLRIDGPSETSLLLRVKASRPQTPLIALVPPANPNLERLARQSGADGFLHRRGQGPGAVAEMSRELSTTERLINRSRASLEQTRALRRRMMELLEQGRPIRAESWNLADVPCRSLVPLLVEDDSDQALLMARSFKRNQLPFPLPVMANGDQAIAYLSGEGKYADRSTFPLPSLVITDLHLPIKSGFEVVAWIRAQAHFEKLVLFMLTSSPSREDIDKAYRLGVDYYFTKPFTLEGFGDLARILAMRWALFFRLDR
jgi:DNA-binding response OmpR family regulator